MSSSSRSFLQAPPRRTATRNAGAALERKSNSSESNDRPRPLSRIQRLSIRCPSRRTNDRFACRILAPTHAVPPSSFPSPSPATLHPNLLQGAAPWSYPQVGENACENQCRVAGIASTAATDLEKFQERAAGRAVDGQVPVLVVPWSCGLLTLVSLPLPSRSLRRRKDGARREEEEGDEAQTGGAEGGKPRGACGSARSAESTRRPSCRRAGGAQLRGGVPPQIRRAHTACGRRCSGRRAAGQQCSKK